MIVTVANQKGGVGKTTTAVTLAHGLALKNYNVLLVDLDPQGQCASLLGLGQEAGIFNLLVNRLPLRDVVRSTRRDGLWLLPGSKRTATAQTLMAVEGYQVDALARLFESAVVNSDQLHYIILDTAPAVGGLQGCALYAADLLLLPAAVDYLSLEGVAEILKTLRGLNRLHPPRVKMLPTFYDQVTRESKTNLALLRESFGEAVLEPIHRAAVLRECPSAGRTIFEHDPNCRAAQEYAALVWEVVNAT